MTIFWILAGGLMALAVLFIVLPLLRDTPTETPPSQGQLNLEVFRRRLSELDADLAAGVLNEDQHAAARNDLERELLHDLNGEPIGAGDTAAGAPRMRGGRAPVLAFLLAIALPVAAIYAYLELGEHGVIQRIEATGPTADATGAPPIGVDGQGMPSLEVLVQGLAARMEQSPDDLEGWLMLGRTYFAIEQPAKALAALERAYQLGPKRPEVMVAYAEALAANASNSLEGRPAELVRAALEIDPANASARWLTGMKDYQQKNFAAAAETWQGILDELDPAGEEAQQMQQMIAEARARAEQETGAPPTSPNDAVPEPTSVAAVEKAAPAPIPATAGAVEDTPATAGTVEDTPATAGAVEDTATAAAPADAVPEPEAVRDTTPTPVVVPAPEAAPPLVAETETPAAAPAAESVPPPPVTPQPVSVQTQTLLQAQAQIKTPQSAPPAASQGVRIQVSVSLSPGLAAQAGPDDTVFVFARAAAGPPMPLAVQRLRVADLPATVTLDDSMAMMPAMRISAFPAIVVGARVSKSGQAMPRPGDLEGQTSPFSVVGSAAVAVTVDQTRP